MNNWDLKYWSSKEYQSAMEEIDDEISKGFTINPKREEIFRALRLTSEKDTRCCIIGQDPYPSARFATGVAFSIPEDIPEKEWPVTLRNFLREYQSDLGLSCPRNGCLEQWCSDGVLLWNAIPSCRTGVSLSHDWPHNYWSGLTSEIIQRLSTKGIVFAFLGSVARRYQHLVDPRSEIIVTSHPSPRGSLNSKTPFNNSRLFSTINSKLVSLGLKPVDWRLNGSVSKTIVQRPVLDRGRVVDNITGAELGGLPRKKSPHFAQSSFEI